MPDAFSNHFPSAAADLLSYRDLGGLVKASYFVFENPPGNVIGTTDRAYLTVLTPNSRIVGGFIMVTQSFGAGVNAATLRRESGNANLFETGTTIDLTSTSAPFLLDRAARGVGQVIPATPANVRGERIYLVLNAASASGQGRLHGVIFYV